MSRLQGDRHAAAPSVRGDPSRLGQGRGTIPCFMLNASPPTAQVASTTWSSPIRFATVSSDSQSSFWGNSALKPPTKTKVFVSSMFPKMFFLKLNGFALNL
jgi:hypothetical protein